MQIWIRLGDLISVHTNFILVRVSAENVFNIVILACLRGPSLISDRFPDGRRPTFAKLKSNFTELSRPQNRKKIPVLDVARMKRYTYLRAFFENRSLKSEFHA